MLWTFINRGMQSSKASELAVSLTHSAEEFAHTGSWTLNLLGAWHYVRGITKCANQHLKYYTKRVQCQAQLDILVGSIYTVGTSPDINSPATFQTMMNDLFQDLISGGSVCIYIDDILIFTKTIKKHKWITRLVLEQLQEHKLFLWYDKYEFKKTCIKYLGLIISKSQVEMNPVKVSRVVE
jgi:hypothetical protein